MHDAMPRPQIGMTPLDPSSSPELGSFGFETLMGTKCNNGYRFDHHAKAIPITIMASAVIIQF
jgi:hypothetical protein